MQGTYTVRATGEVAAAMLPADNCQGVHFHGYRAAVPQTRRFNGDPMKADDAALQLDSWACVTPVALSFINSADSLLSVKPMTAPSH